MDDAEKVQPRSQVFINLDLNYILVWSVLFSKFASLYPSTKVLKSINLDPVQSVVLKCSSPGMFCFVFCFFSYLFTVFFINFHLWERNFDFCCQIWSYFMWTSLNFLHNWMFFGIKKQEVFVQFCYCVRRGQWPRVISHYVYSFCTVCVIQTSQ